ncbi:MAG TPA: efflux RND transporter periplasmic adaptor subunit, partial [Vicinamibacterales bacterium]|nr:efflux RND transporter periplasmic adaptor subunit [Vicinamibacterales bacterium]
RTRSLAGAPPPRSARVACLAALARRRPRFVHTLSVVAVSLVCLGCNRSAAPEAPPEEPEALSVTKWTGKTELFAEYPPLAVGSTSRFAIHLTRMDTFKALTEGNVEVRLEDGSAQPEVFRVDAPSRPGIFGVDVKPAHAGRRQLVIVLRSADLNDEHRVGDVDVHPNAEAARAASPPAGEETPGISFLKEQQWSLDFGTALVEEQAVRESLRVPARLEARPGGAADVVAPIGGRLTRVLDLPAGASVTRGQELARLLPPPAVPGDLPQLQREHAEARTTLALATRDRERAERLTKVGAAPGKRLDEARTAEEQARTRLAAAEASLAQYEATRAGGTTDAEGLFVIRSSIGGVIAARDAATGANVTAGTLLFRVVDAAQVHVVGQVPEADAARARAVSAAEIEIPGREGRLPAGRLASVGKVLDPESRTLPITFAFDNRTQALPVGQSVFLHLLMDTTAPRPVVPASALVDDAGRPIVFVQREGETFDRRAVTLGPRTGDVVQILEGVRLGDRVVTKGAYLGRLASLSTSVPAHGHVH